MMWAYDETYETDYFYAKQLNNTGTNISF